MAQYLSDRGNEKYSSWSSICWQSVLGRASATNMRLMNGLMQPCIPRVPVMAHQNPKNVGGILRIPCVCQNLVTFPEAIPQRWLLMCPAPAETLLVSAKFGCSNSISLSDFRIWCFEKVLYSLWKYKLSTERLKCIYIYSYIFDIKYGGQDLYCHFINNTLGQHCCNHKSMGR